MDAYRSVLGLEKKGLTVGISSTRCWVVLVWVTMVFTGCVFKTGLVLGSLCDGIIWQTSKTFDSLTADTLALRVATGHVGVFSHGAPARCWPAEGVGAVREVARDATGTDVDCVGVVALEVGGNWGLLWFW
jgi:hypothetical protein